MIPLPIVGGDPSRPALHADQARAVELATDPRRHVVVVTGAPGTGKTFTIRTILERLACEGHTVALAAPTGKAARRMTEQTGREAVTIHRLLGPMKTAKGTWVFEHGPSNPLPYAAVVLDECSMIDVELGARVLSALSPQARLVLVGDTNQLPSVGPGSFLGDLLASSVVPSVELTKIKRQNPGAIVTSCHAIRDGRAPRILNGLGDDLVLQAADDEEEIAEAIVELVSDRLPRALLGFVGSGKPFDPLRDIQVLSPVNDRGPLSCEALNARLQQIVCPGGRSAGKDDGSGPKLRVGDKVIQVKNDYELGVLNGDIGIVRDLTSDDRGKPLLRVAFENPLLRGERELVVTIPEKGNDLRLAYAITVHKAQGSEFPVVVIPVHRSFPPQLVTRNWIYTAVSRAARFCVLVGQERAFTGACRRVAPTRRTTGLAHMLRAGAAQGRAA